MDETIELRELRVFLTLAEELHFGRTADRLGISQSRVSQAVRTLEARVGGRLFQRTSRSVRLTPTGQRLLEGMRPAYDRVQQAFRDAREAATGITGPLRIGMYARMICGPHWLEIVKTFRARHPSCDVELIHWNFDVDYLERLRSGQVEMLVLRLPLSGPEFTVGPILSREDRVMLVAKDDVMATRRSARIEEFAGRAQSDHPMMPREMMDAFIPPTTADGTKIRRISIRSFEEGLMLVAAGELVHPTTANFANYYVHDGVVAVPISDLPPSETALVWLTSSDRSPTILAFAQAARDVLATHSGGPAAAGRFSPRRDTAAA